MVADGSGFCRAFRSFFIEPDRIEFQKFCVSGDGFVRPPCGATRSGSNFLSPLFNGKSRSGRKVAPNIGDSCEFAASPVAATRRAGRLEGGHNGPNGPKSPFGLLGIPVI